MKRTNSEPAVFFWQHFEQFVADVLRLGGFTIRANAKVQGRQTDVWCTASNSLLSARVIIECKATKRNASLPLEYVTEFCNRLSLARASGTAELGWLITNYRIPDNAWLIIKDAHLDGACNILHPQELLAKLIDIPGYLSQLQLSLTRSVTGYVDPDLETVTAIGKNYASKSTFTRLLNEWLGDAGRPLLLLLGDYGQGKTTCCEEILHRYSANPTSFSGRIPLFIRLRDVANQGYNLASLFRVCLQEQFGLNYNSFELLDYLAKKGLFIFIFDGLDEITYTLRWSEIFEALKQITRIAYSKNKILITSRPGVFPPKTAIVHSLERVARLFPDLQNPNYPIASYLIAYLKYFKEPQIREAMAHFGIVRIDEALATMQSIHDLTDLAKRPITLRLILESLEPLRSGAIKGHADLYDRYTSRWLSRDGWRSNIESISIEVGRDLKREFVQDLAWDMYRSNALQIEASFVEENIRKHADEFQVTDELIRAFGKELAICSFLDSRKDGTLEFSHNSFLEYFLASYLASLDRSELLNALTRHAFDYEVLAFLTQLMDWESFVRNEIGSEVEHDRTLATNTIQASALANVPVVGMTRFLPGVGIRCNSDEAIITTVSESEPYSVEMISQVYLDLRFRSCNLVHLKARSPKELQIALEDTSINEIEIEGADLMHLSLIESSIAGGVVQGYQSCALKLQGAVRLQGVVFDNFKNLSIVCDGKSIPQNDNFKFMIERGARSKTQYKKQMAGVKGERNR